MDSFVGSDDKTNPGNDHCVRTGYVAPTGHLLGPDDHRRSVSPSGVCQGRSALTLYIDGTSAGTTTDNSTGTTTNTSVLVIGGAKPPSHFTGSLDDVRLFNRGLSVDEIKDLYLGSAAVLLLSPSRSHG